MAGPTRAAAPAAPASAPSPAPNPTSPSPHLAASPASSPSPRPAAGPASSPSPRAAARVGTPESRAGGGAVMRASLARSDTVRNATARSPFRKWSPLVALERDRRRRERLVAGGFFCYLFRAVGATNA